MLFRKRKKEKSLHDEVDQIIKDFDNSVKNWNRSCIVLDGMNEVDKFVKKNHLIEPKPYWDFIDKPDIQYKILMLKASKEPQRFNYCGEEYIVVKL